MILIVKLIRDCLKYQIENFNKILIPLMDNNSQCENGQSVLYCVCILTGLKMMQISSQSATIL